MKNKPACSEKEQAGLFVCKFQFVALLEVDTVGEGLDPPLTFRLQNGLFHVGNTVFAYYIQRDRRYVEGGSRPSPTG